ncbi:MAG TPA: serine/threonine-protein kinase [Candidatus Eisenbacteria bacterium]|nr:serine/threonine-protein kinase [Candidatus Eisenbacteria bacterium]
MTSDSRHQRVKEAVYEAQGLVGEARLVFLERLDAEDVELAAEVRSLLDEKTRLDATGRGVTAVAADLLRRSGAAADAAAGGVRQVGPYRLLEVIGTGGMGAVYRAEQLSPIHREVAVKLLVGGISVGRLAERFVAEQHALARMNHPGIARILDAGGDETGTPYLVMELVRGAPITEFCREKRLPPRDVLELFVSVCRAVQHAHQKGIIHRDLKPANILVAEVDGKPAAKIIDFGIARVVESDGGPARGALLTGEGQVLGTLEYMSPEQATGRVRQIDTRTDVYSLGAVLYELLTGALPHDLRGLSLTEAISVIANDAPRPFRVTRTAGRRPAGDLETIVRKALEAEPVRRYEGAGALADDVERYLRAEPIVARPPSTFYQLRTTMRRHRSAVLVGGALFVGLVVFGVSMSFLYAGQTRERERAEAEAARAKAVNAFLEESFAAANPNDLGARATAVQVFHRALARIDQAFGAQPDIRASLKHTFGETIAGLGEPIRAESLLTVALSERARIHDDHHPDLFATRLALGGIALERSQFHRADSIAADALLRRGGAATNSEKRDALRLRGRAVYRSDAAVAESLLAVAYELAVSAHPRDESAVGDLLQERGEVAAAREEYGQADSLYRASIGILTRTRGEYHPSTLSAYDKLAMNLAASLAIDSALAVFRANLERHVHVYGPDHVRVADARNNLATSLLRFDQVGEAEQLFRRAVATWERQYGPAHENVAIGYSNVAYSLHCLDRLEEAEAWYRKSLESAVAARLDQNGSLWYRNLAAIAIDRGHLVDAMHWARRAVSWSAGTDFHWQRGVDLQCLAEVHLDAGRPDSALHYEEISLAELRRDQVPETHSGPVVLALALARTGRVAESDSILSAVRGPLVNGRVDWPVDKRRAYRRLVAHYRGIGRPEEVAYYRAALNRLPR